MATGSPDGTNARNALPMGMMIVVGDSAEITDGLNMYTGKAAQMGVPDEGSVRLEVEQRGAGETESVFQAEVAWTPGW